MPAGRRSRKTPGLTHPIHDLWLVPCLQNGVTFRVTPFLPDLS